MKPTLLVATLLLLAPSALAQSAPAPCVLAANECTEWVALGPGAARSLVYRTYALTTTNSRIARALILVHGASRNADHYFTTATAAAFLGHALDDTIGAAWIRNDWTPELRADAWAGCTLAKSNLNPIDLHAALGALAKYPSPAHPAWNLRVPVIRSGYTHCGGAAASFDSGLPGKKAR